MEIEPLLSSPSEEPTSPSPSPLPEDEETSIPTAETPSQLKERLIFAPVTSPAEAPESNIRLPILLLLLYVVVGAIIYWIKRHNFAASATHPFVDAFYFSIVKMCTIGYGDITPNSVLTKWVSILFVLVGVVFVDVFFNAMVSYVLNFHEQYLLKNIEDIGGTESRWLNMIGWAKWRTRMNMKVAWAQGIVVLCLGVSVGVVHFVEELGWLDSFYLSVMSVTTAGYGDRAFQSMLGRIFACFWLYLSTVAVGHAFMHLAEIVVDKWHKKMAKGVPGQETALAELLAADIDNNCFVSKSEYVIYKLKRMRKISEKDMTPLCRKFDELDTGNCGKIALSNLRGS